MVNPEIEYTRTLRLLRSVSFGLHFGIGLRHVPSGKGPSLHPLPQLSMLAHFQSPPRLDGMHSKVARHRPLESGPIGQV